MKVLVTGGAGFIGGHVAQGYLSRGDAVWVVDDLSTGHRENVPDGATFHQMSIGDPALDRLFAEVGFDLVNHHAAQINVRVSVADPARDAETNILGLLNVLECARKHAVKRVVFISSGGVVYGEPEEIPTPETAPKLPLSPYGVTKLTGEYYLQYYQRVHGLDYVALRYANVFGPHQDPAGEAGVIAIFCTRLLAGEALSVYGDGAQTRDYVFVGDLVQANLLVSDLALPQGGTLDDRAFNIGTGEETSVLRLAQVLEEVSELGTGARHFYPARDGELRRSTLNASKLRAVGWAPQVSLEDGLRETFQWITGRDPKGKGGGR